MIWFQIMVSYVVYVCVHVSDGMQCVCVSVCSTVAEWYKAPKSHDHISLATHAADGPSFIVLSILHCLLWELGMVELQVLIHTQ